MEEKLKEKRGVLGGAAACSRGTLVSNHLTEMTHLLDLTKQPTWLFKFWPSVWLSSASFLGQRMRFHSPSEAGRGICCTR